MDILYLLIPLSLVLVFVIAALFWWSLQSGQYEDLEGPGHRILMDDDQAGRSANETSNEASNEAEAGPIRVKPDGRN